METSLYCWKRQQNGPITGVQCRRLTKPTVSTMNTRVLFLIGDAPVPPSSPSQISPRSLRGRQLPTFAQSQVSIPTSDDPAMPCTLHTFRCAHFACETVSTTCIEVLDNFAHHAANALEIFCQEKVERHIAYPVRCPMCQDPIDLAQSRRDAHKAIDGLIGLMEAAVEQYECLGRKYHETPFSFGARTADSRKAALAHKQFGINAMSLDDDPFFGLWNAIIGGLNTAQELLCSLERRESVGDLNLAERLCFSDELADEESPSMLVQMDNLQEALGMINEARGPLGLFSLRR